MKTTISEVLSYFDNQVPNQYSDEEKIRWLNEMIVDLEYSELYRFWLEKSVHYANGEIDRMNNAMTMFQTYYDNYFSYYNRNHRPVGTHGYRL